MPRRILGLAALAALIVGAAPAMAQTAAVSVAVAGPSSGTVRYRGSATYTVTITNAGPSSATGVTIDSFAAGQQVLPGGVAAVNPVIGAVSGCTPVGATKFPCSVADITDLAGSATVTVAVSWPSEDPVPLAAASCPAGATVPAATVTVSAANDSTTGDDTASSGTLTISNYANLSVTLDGPTSGAEGALLTYTGSVENLGPCAAANIAVNWVGHLSLTYETGTGADGCAAFDEDRYRCTLGTIAAGATAPFSAGFRLGSFPSDQTSVRVINAISVPTLTGTTTGIGDVRTADTAFVLDLGGGCSTGLGVGGLSLLSLALLALRRRRS